MKIKNSASGMNIKNNPEDQNMKYSIQNRLHPANFDPGNDKPLYSEDGIDLTLIRWMLSLTYQQRLEVLQQNINAIQVLRNAEKTY